MVNYSESSIYKLCCRDVNVKEIYVGSTVNFIRRKHSHKNCCNNENNKDYNTYVYQFIRDNGGFNNFDMIEVERYKAIDKKDLEKRERYWIETLGADLNKIIPTRTIKEWYKDNKEVINEKRKEHYQDNKEKILEYHIRYYKKNKEKVKEYREEKITCECGSIINKNHLARHQKSIKHKVWENIYNFIYS